MPQINQIPPAGTPMIDQRGRVTPEWYRWFVSLLGGASEAQAGEISTPTGSGLSGGGLVADGLTLSIEPGGVTDSMIRDGLGCSVIGRFLDSEGQVADIQATANDRVLGRFGDMLVFKDISLIPASVGDGDYGDITVSGSGAVWTIDNGVVSNAKLANMATARFKGRTTAGTGEPEDLTATQATALLDAFTSGAKGLAPASGGGTAAYLRADGSWTSTLTPTAVNWDASFTAQVVATVPTIAFDANDYMNYDRSTNLWSLFIGGAAALTINATDIAFSSNFYVTVSGGNPSLVFDGNDYLTYDRTGDLFRFFVGGAQVAELGTAGFAGAGFVSAAAYVKTTPKTVATLTAAATAGAGARDMVTDAMGPVWGAAVVGGGAVTAPVYSDGAAWNVG